MPTQTSQRSTKLSQLRRATTINKSLGTTTAARYMALRGWSIEAALYTLTNSTREIK